MRELERQQKEAEENADRVYDMYTGNNPRFSLKTNQILCNVKPIFYRNKNKFQLISKVLSGSKTNKS